MRLVRASEVQRLTGLSADQLREWTTRRGLIEPDLKPNGPGSRARFAWQTVLLLRLAVVLKESFHIELHAQRGLFQDLAERLAKVSFPALRGFVLVIGREGNLNISPIEEIRSPTADILMLHLDPHLDVLSTEFGLNEPIRQLPLFPARVVG
jgi:hypothetical protein